MTFARGAWASYVCTLRGERTRYTKNSVSPQDLKRGLAHARPNKLHSTVKGVAIV